MEDKELAITFHGRIIDQLGFQTYQSPTASIAELIANCWDADAEEVKITIPEPGDSDPIIVVEDDGIGMTFEECEARFLNVGYPRRGDSTEELSSEKNRPILGRKGIGKFAGFGIANVIHVKTISKSTGEHTEFDLDRDKLVTDEYMVEGGILDAKFDGPDDSRKSEHGTVITLKNLNMERMTSKSRFPKSMARRFLLHQRYDDFKILINGEPLPESEDLEKIQFSFPKDYKDEEKYAGLTITDEWGEEVLSNDEQVRWRIVFYEDTISDDEFQGVSIFSNGKLSQNPFTFNLTGGLGGQAGLAYLSGQIEADFVDKLDVDPLSAERQRINWGIPETSPLLLWGQAKIKELLVKWHDRRGEKRRQELEDKVAGFSDRLDALPSKEAITLRKVLGKLGGIATLTQEQFNTMGESILTAWEGGEITRSNDRYS